MYFVFGLNKKIKIKIKKSEHSVSFILQLVEQLILIIFLFSLSNTEGIKLMSPVDVSVIGFTSEDFDVFLLSAEMTKRDWHLSTLQFPSGYVAIC